MPNWLRFRNFGATILVLAGATFTTLITVSDSHFIAKFEFDDCRRFFGEENLGSDLISAGPRPAIFGERPLQLSCEWQREDGTRFEAHVGTWRETYLLASSVSLIFVAIFTFLGDVLRAIIRMIHSQRTVKFLLRGSYLVNLTGLILAAYWFLNISGILI